MRPGLRQGPASMNATGRPPSAAASTRSGRPLPGQVPVQAARVSDAASQFHSGSAGWSFVRSRSASVNSGPQSTGDGTIGASRRWAGIVSKCVSRPS